MKSVSLKLAYGLTAVVRNANVAEDDTMSFILPPDQLQIWARALYSFWPPAAFTQSSGALHAANASETFCQSVTDATKTASCSHWICESQKMSTYRQFAVPVEVWAIAAGEGRDVRSAKQPSPW